MTTATKKTTTSVDPSLLAPDFDDIDGELIAEEYTFWLGVTADCPRGQIDVAGLHFPKSEERIIHNDAGKQVRVPEHGTINMTVTKYHFEELVKVLSRLVVRPSRSEDMDNPTQRAKGKLVKIPTKAQVAGAAESGRKLKPYIKRTGDRPATEFMYFIHAPDGVRGKNFQTIAEVGLEWPAVIQETEDILD